MRTPLSSAKLREYYRVLELPAGASHGEIKAKYRRLVKQWHPDVHRGNPDRSEERIRAINEAFRQLETRSVRELKAAATRPARQPGQPSRAPGARARTRLWKRRRRRAPSPAAEVPRTPLGYFQRRGRDIFGEVEISGEELRAGARWKLVVPTCGSCGGWGAALGTELEICSACHGLGLRSRRRGFRRRLGVCRRCRGRGGHFETSCQACGGTGESSTMTVRCHLPPGFGHGGCGVLEGEGHPGVCGGKPGDLYLFLAVV